MNDEWMRDRFLEFIWPYALGKAANPYWCLKHGWTSTCGSRHGYLIAGPRTIDEILVSYEGGGERWER